MTGPGLAEVPWLRSHEKRRCGAFRTSCKAEAGLRGHGDSSELMGDREKEHRQVRVSDPLPKSPEQPPDVRRCPQGLGGSPASLRPRASLGKVPGRGCSSQRLLATAVPVILAVMLP